jgi:hypothetical protein
MAYAGFDTASSLWTRFMARWARRKLAIGEVGQEVNDDE